MKKRIAILAPIAALILSLPLQAKEVPLDVLSGYLNSLTSFQASFVQVNADGSKSKGVIYVQRPGRARFEYAAPDKNLVIAAGGQVVIFDAKSNAPPEQYPLSRTPLNLILAASVNLGAAKMVVGHQEVGNATIVRAQDPKHPNFCPTCIPPNVTEVWLPMSSVMIHLVSATGLSLNTSSIVP